MEPKLNCSSENVILGPVFTVSSCVSAEAEALLNLPRICKTTYATPGCESSCVELAESFGTSQEADLQNYNSAMTQATKGAGWVISFCNVRLAGTLQQTLQLTSLGQTLSFGFLHSPHMKIMRSEAKE